jgi:DNA-binding transcriptional regulator YiaG
MSQFLTTIEKAQREHGLSDRELGQLFGVCRVQVGRWKEGRSLPIPAAQETVIRFLESYQGPEGA